MQTYHFIGIGGIGMSGLARILLSKKANVAGSDIANSYVTEGLIAAGAKVYIGHDARYISPQSIVIFSSDIKSNNPEYCEAKRLGCTLLHRSDLLLQLMESKKTLSIAGTHGKTTTSALLTEVLIGGELEPSFAVGGILPLLNTNAGHGAGEYFIAEADESDGTFLKYTSFGAIVTNIDLDHLNYFGTEENLIKSFKEFSLKVQSPQQFFWCGDDERLLGLNLPGFSYGFNSKNSLRIINSEQRGWKLFLDIVFQGKEYKSIEIALVGKHNALNGCAVFGMGLNLGIPEELLRKSLAKFAGVKRRCEKKGEAAGILMLDDYAHHPTEIKTTLEGIRKAIGKQKLVAIFQPHRYSRTKDCLGSYDGIFTAADQVIITDIFAAGESPITDVNHNKIMEEVQQTLCYIPRQNLVSELAKILQKGDVAVTLGAGDVTKVGPAVLEMLSPTKSH